MFACNIITIPCRVVVASHTCRRWAHDWTAPSPAGRHLWDRKHGATWAERETHQAGVARHVVPCSPRSIFA